MSEFIFDDEYEGPRFTYGVTLRPVTRFNIPDGWIIGSDRPNPSYRFGTIDYPYQLSPDKISHYDLIPQESTNA